MAPPRSPARRPQELSGELSVGVSKTLSCWTVPGPSRSVPLYKRRRRRAGAVARDPRADPRARWRGPAVLSARAPAPRRKLPRMPAGEPSATAVIEDRAADHARRLCRTRPGASPYPAPYVRSPLYGGPQGRAVAAAADHGSRLPETTSATSTTPTASSPPSTAGSSAANTTRSPAASNAVKTVPAPASD